MTDLPVWLQEIRDRVDKATPGPWENIRDTSVFRGDERIAVIPIGDRHAQDTAFIAHSRTDMPRLLELVEEMATRLIAAYDALGELKGEVMENYMVQSLCRVGAEIRLALAKYRREVESDD